MKHEDAELREPFAARVSWRDRERIQRRRLACAMVGIAALFVVLMLAEFAEARTSIPTLLDVWGQWGEYQRLSEESIPEGFEEEILALEDKQEVRIDHDARTVGYSFFGKPVDAFNELRSNLVNGGWDEIPSGIEGCSAFIKESGRYRWVFVQCVSVKEWTSVVISYSCQ